MITRIGIENFKSFPNQEFIEPLPFTLLIGDNGSGKSTYIQTLAFMSQNPDVISIADGQFINQGGFDQLVYDKEKVLTIHVDGKITQDAEGYSYLNDIIYHLDIKFDQPNKDNSARIICSLELEKPKDIFSTKLGKEDKTIFTSEWDKSLGQQPVTVKLYDEIDDIVFAVAIQLNPTFSFQISGWITAINQEQKRRVSALFANLKTKIRADFANITYIPALRGIDTRFQNLLQRIPNQPLDSLNFNNQSNLLSSSLAYNRDLEEKISSLMELILNRKCRTMLRQGIVISVETFNGVKWVNIMNEGFGANPLVQLIYQIVSAPKNSFVLIEEPEIHLFPAAQKRLIIELIKFAKIENKRLLITTHSPHIYAVLSQIKDKNDEEVKIYFFERDDSTNTSKVQEITSSNREGMLKEFLGMNLGEIASILESAGI